MRGYAAIGLHQPKIDANIGGALRAAGCYGASLVAISGKRYKRQITDTQAAHRHIPVICTEGNILDLCPFDCVPIAIEFLPEAKQLPFFTHPERAFYIFGAEDQTLGKEITTRCKHTIIVPTKFCMNLSATVNVVLYDGIAKHMDRDHA